ncbi:hypothetical protein O6H91_18G060800 [Diphasiastrum complanatum]|uniref:Uncharacterized protein n=1 Tax=Diphasiastrum complanatum TaxID=34168 RepID=A0ACC2B1U9_DIPCM|nr:hypothetical protein O6H91_18G060800 [Diphasiastrum complanatum]
MARRRWVVLQSTRSSSCCRMQWLKHTLVFMLFLGWACFRAWTSAVAAASASNGGGISNEEWQKGIGSSVASVWRRRLREAAVDASGSAGAEDGVSCKDCKKQKDAKLGFKVCAGITDEKPVRRCEYARRNCRGSNKSNINYVALHYCTLQEQSWISVPLLIFGVIASFVFLAETAESHFSPVARSLVNILNMSPSMGGVTLLALGNGAPDVFGSMAAILGGNPRIGMGAILSAGTFVSAFVVGVVAMVAAPFSVKPVYFVRDVVFYTVAVALLFSLYISGIVHFWQALGLVFFYLLFVLVVIFMDLIRHLWQRYKISNSLEENKLPDLGSFNDSMYVEASDNRSTKGQDWHSRDVEIDRSEDHGLCSELIRRITGCQERQLNQSHHIFNIDPPKSLLERFTNKLFLFICPTIISTSWFPKRLKSQLLKVKVLLLTPVRLLLSATIPASDPSQWNRFYTSTSIFLCPIMLMFMFQAVVPFNYQITFLLPNFQLPLWFLVFVQGMVLACAYYLEMEESPKSTHTLLVILAFVMSVCWISFIAGELLGFLAALGVVLHVPPSLLGLTVLAWGNSVGDLVADVAVARSGQPEMAIAGCYAGPMFNMLLGLGSALAIHTAQLIPSAYILLYHPSIIIAFGFLFLSLLGSLLVVTYSKFQVTKTWGICLISLYIVFTVVSLCTATITI